MKYHCCACWLDTIKRVFVSVASTDKCCDSERTISRMDGVLVHDARNAFDEHFRWDSFSIKGNPIFGILARFFGKETTVGCKSGHAL